MALALLVSSSPAMGSRASPTWSEYHGGRLTESAWRALAEGRLADARAGATSALELVPDDPPALTVHTRASIGLADWETAHTTATKLVALGPGEPEALELLGLVSVELGNAEEATRCFVELGKLQPTLAGPLLGRALVAARLEGDRGRAIATLRRARVLDPTLDLTTLLLKPEWTSLAEDQEFVTALNTLLAELRASE